MPKAAGFVIAIMMSMFSTAVNIFHGSSSTETPYTNLHQLTAPDIDLNDFKFSSLANEVNLGQPCTCHRLAICKHASRPV